MSLVHIATKFELCPYCNESFWDNGGRTTDHVHPKSRGGSNATDNLVTACRRCNRDKADLLPTEWYGWLLAANDRRCRIVFAALRQAAGIDSAVWTRIAIDGARGYRIYALRYKKHAALIRVKPKSDTFPAWLPVESIPAWKSLNAARVTP